jgi:glyoxylase I family protein
MSSSLVVTHLAFRCRNLAAQEAFYTKHFGFKRSRTFHRGESGEFFLLKLGAMRLELFPPDPAQPVAQGGEQTVGFRHLAFEVPKLEPMIESLRADGIQPDSIIELPQIAEGFRIVFFRDPEGNIIELMEGYRDE